MQEITMYHQAADVIKEAILKSQYEAVKDVNAHQLSLYFGIGRFISENTRAGRWGTGAVEAISRQLQRDLPGLRGFSATNLKMMRTFYEEWSKTLNSSDASDELQQQTLAEENEAVGKSSDMSDDLTLQLKKPVNGINAGDFFAVSNIMISLWVLPLTIQRRICRTISNMPCRTLSSCGS